MLKKGGQEKMSKVKVLLVDDNEVLKNLITAYFNKKEDVEVVGSVGEGGEALKILEDSEVDVMLLDIIMPRMDGFAVLDEIQRLEPSRRPNIIVLSALGQEDIICKAAGYGIKYYMVKPFDLALLYKRVLEASMKGGNAPSLKSGKRGMEVHSMDEKITSIFLMIGIPAHIKGYQYLRYAINMVIEKPDAINRITKELYPGISRHFDTTPSKVERAIRHAIEVAWTRGKIENINQIFGYNIYSKNDKPTNGEFIALIADRLSIDMTA
jgi:two-component system response regulator (stage 0 sporulation protein A)